MKPQLALLLLTLTILTGKFTVAADSSVNYEELTYRLYLEHKWDSLLQTGEKAIAEGYDYYYMRARVGVAAFELGKFVRASRHLEKACEFNNGDPFAAGLLYRAYVYSGRAGEAQRFQKSLPAYLAESTGGWSLNPVLYLEAGPSFTDHPDRFEQNRQQGSGLYSEAYLNKHSVYSVAGAIIPLSGRLTLNAAGAWLDFARTRHVGISGLDTLVSDYHVRQAEGYLSPSIYIGKHLRLSPAFRMVQVSYENTMQSSDPAVQQLIGPTGSSSYYDTGIGGEVAWLNPYWELSAGYWSLETDRKKTIQLGSNLILRPLGSLNFYTSTSLLLLHKEEETKTVFAQMAGGRIIGRLWAELWFSSGDLSGGAEGNLQVFYNAYDRVQNRYGVRFIYPVNDYLKFSLRGQLFTKTGSELFFSGPEIGKIHTYDYQTLTITGGLSWNIK
ncbi:MAG TPA: hypothetical protein PLV51_13350 [Lentimicrobium sp.]|jgi:tetratricopeptide (TPR) repeat protein|nr:hypothetical protein [Lentimicrobium sp.]